jgi:hypothetical protein
VIATEQQIRMAARLYEARDALLRLQGAEGFARTVANTRPAVEAYMEHYQVSELTAAMQMCERVRFDGFAQLAILATVVEMIEPSRSNARG